jgi:hypothetical protein
VKVPHYHLVPKGLAENLKFRRALLDDASRDPRMADQLRLMCAEDLLFYVNTFCWTYDPRLIAEGLVPVTPFITYPFQDEAMLELVDCVEKGRDAAIPKSRDMGASWICVTAPVEWLWHFRENLSFLLVSRNEDYVDKRGDSKALFWKIDFLHRHQPQWLLPTGRWLGDKDPGRKTLHLENADNGSIIDGESTTGDAGRGDRRTAMLIDEHAAFNPDDGFRILKATRDTTRCRIFNSTPQGAQNGFYEVVHKTAAKILRLHWSKHPEKSRGLYTTDKETGKVVLLDKWRGRVELREKGVLETRTVRFPDEYPFQLDQVSPKLRSPWYDNECSRCVSPLEVAQELDIDFVGSAYTFFDSAFLDVIKARYARDPVATGFLEFDHETLRPIQFREDVRGNANLWFALPADGRPGRDRRFEIGVDISAGTGASNSVACVVDRATGEKIARVKSPNILPADFADLCMALGYFFNDSRLTWDAGGPTGQTFTNRVVKHGYPHIYYRRNEKKVTQEVTTTPGYFLNSQARAVLLEDYRRRLDRHQYINRSAESLEEAKQFVRLPDGGVEHSAAVNSQDPSGARSAHGDEVIADALASIAMHEDRSEEKPEDPGTPVGSLAWRREQAVTASADKTRGGLGEGW